MTISKLITSGSLALAILGGVAFIPAPVEAARTCNPQISVCKHKEPIKKSKKPCQMPGRACLK